MGQRTPLPFPPLQRAGLPPASSATHTPFLVLLPLERKYHLSAAANLRPHTPNPWLNLSCLQRQPRHLTPLSRVSTARQRPLPQLRRHPFTRRYIPQKRQISQFSLEEELQVRQVVWISCLFQPLHKDFLLPPLLPLVLAMATGIAPMAN